MQQQIYARDVLALHGEKTNRRRRQSEAEDEEDEEDEEDDEDDEDDDNDDGDDELEIMTDLEKKKTTSS